MNFNYVLRSILALVIIIWLANMLLGILNKYAHGQSRSIQIIERYSINKNSSLAIVKIVNDYYLMSFNAEGNQVLKEFSADEVDDIVENLQYQQDMNVTQFFEKIDFAKTKDKYSTFLKKDQE